MTNAARARAVLRDAIYSGVYPVGSHLPSSRELAARFGINRNTASKIYQEFARDQLVELVPNRPPTVSGAWAARPSESLHDRIRESLLPLLDECRLLGLKPSDVSRVVDEVIDESFSMYRQPVVYVAECNEEEARALAQDLAAKLGIVVQPVLLNELHAEFPADMVVAPYFHFLEAQRNLGAGRQTLVGMVVSASASDIGRIASMVRERAIGAVGFHLLAAERLRGLLSFQIEVAIISAAIDQPETLAALEGRVDFVACTVRSYASVRRILPEIPAVLVQYHVDDESVNRLRHEIQRRSK